MQALEELHPIDTELPVACTLTQDELRDRGQENALLFAAHDEARELPDGYAVRFPGNPELAPKLLAFMLAERACCHFFSFSLVFEPAEGPFWLHIRGPEGTKEVVHAMLNRGMFEGTTPQCSDAEGGEP